MDPGLVVDVERGAVVRGNIVDERVQSVFEFG
jgi:hypothetical protein